MSLPRILGVDAGGTGTRAVLVSDGAVVARFEDGPLNLLLHDDAFERLVLLIKESGATAAGLGLAGLRGVAEGRALQDKLRAATGVDVAVADDTEVALLGAFDGGPGIVVIAGTGSTAFGRAAQGRAARVGGHG
ncbi:MAG TPA: BadF/BadG/BcrA/BcrD ATPase family protein, partial [Acidothermaceae bacterium]